MKRHAWLLAASLLTVLAASGEAKELEEIDFRGLGKALPEMKRTIKASNESVVEINRLMNELLQTEDDREAAKIRSRIRPLLEAHRKMKIDMISLIDQCLPRRQGGPKRTNLEAFRALRTTNLRRVTWNNTFLKHVVRDISQAIGVNVRLTFTVQGLNQVDIQFPEVNAEAVLNLICNNFDLSWIIYGGEVHVTRRLNRNEQRFLEYESRHGKVDWISEAEIRFAKDLEVKTPRRELENLEDMDLILLKASLLKLYVLEGESAKYEARLKDLELSAAIADPDDEHSRTPEGKERRIKRHKHILHYLYKERDNSIEVWDVLNRVLGIYLELEGEDPELRKLLDTEIAQLAWQDKELEEALYELGRFIGVDVEVELPPFTELRVTLTVENVTAETVIGLICEIHPLVWRYADGRLFFAHEDK